jgi:hypothetical protein
MKVPIILGLGGTRGYPSDQAARDIDGGDAEIRTNGR